MRLRIEVTTQASSIPWDNLLRPGRGLIYNLLSEAAPDLATRLHEEGWGRHRIVPFGHGAPTFPKARRTPGVYGAGGRGWLELGSPLPEVVEAWQRALADRQVLDWGGVALQVRKLVPVEAPAFADGKAEFRTATPVVLKAPVLAPAGASGGGRHRELLPYEEGFMEAFHHNLRRKAETLDLDPEVTATRTWVGAKRSFTVKSGRRVGAPLGVELQGSPALLRALWSWGLGQANPAGFGWIAP
ncbi:CRISPR-associated endoribonuclease Cas6 [Goodfellowiella coeruleoviolacea]|uniref:CRISPR-associated endoribonuclease Cas6 n=1 Tax=Goodfellowiella coeruleoviolacea TaxID=334858 RepID=A0AAE3GLD8_9PSEU|nr:CRISPR-associated endoribonuclease Cas6 [Goodfellowiella coeruleoviolacea]MCP2170351.1 CRISPR-associated endoribonuclease Cas6 [Goodfellowiella coeruleoviolacea]